MKKKSKVKVKLVKAVKKPPAKLSYNDVKEDQPELDKLLADRKRREELRKKAESSKKSAENIDDTNEINFWICLVFQSWKQREEFLASPQLKDVPTYQGVYVDGETMAESLGIKLKKTDLKPFVSPLDKRLVERVMKTHR